MLQNLCPDAVPQLLGFFDFSVAPNLLFYAYVPAIIVSLLLAVFVLVRDKFSLQSKLLGLIAIAFALWTFNIFIQWVAAPVSAVMFAWQLTALFESAIFVFSMCFVQVFVSGGSLSLRRTLPLALAALPVLVLLPTTLNVSAFDLAYCEGIVGPLWYYVYGLEIVSLIWIWAYTLRAYIRESDHARRVQLAYLGIGMVAFLGLFAASNIAGELTQVYAINLVGPIGMVVFVALLGYLIVKYRTFHTKLIATDALMWALCILIGSQLFFVTVRINFLIIGITLSLAMFFGLILSRSVRREVAAREGLQILSDELQKTNTQLNELSHFKSQLLSLASHQIKAPLAAIKGYLSLVLEGGYGAVPEPLKKPVEAMQHSANGLVDLISSLLDLRKIEEGKMDYQFARTDLASIVRDVVEEMGMLATTKKLQLNVSGADGMVWVRADAPKLRQVVLNFVDNAIKYTPSGSVSVKLVAEDRHATCTVSDTGLGMSPALLPRLFDEFTRDQRVQHTIRGTGLGLYIAKRIIEAHGGTAHAESDGEGKGSRFILSLPLDQSQEA